MLIVTYMSVIAALISIMMITVSLILSKKTTKDREKSSPFECGFDPKSSPRLPFSLQFFLIAVIFIIFDVEIALLLPLIVVMKSTSSYWYIFITLSFLMILLGGLYHEWKYGALEWAL